MGDAGSNLSTNISVVNMSKPVRSEWFLIPSSHSTVLAPQVIHTSCICNSKDV